MPSKNYDFAQKETDKELYRLEKKIEAVYRDASQDMQKKIDKFFSAFEAQDKEKQELLKLGKITKEQYISWRMQNFTKGGRYITMRDAFAERMLKANQVAAAYINDATPGIYSLNYNFSAYDIEKACGNLGFVLYDEQTIKRLIEKSPSLLPYYPQKAAIKRGMDLAWTKKKILEQITSGILQGEGTMTIAKNLRTAIPGMSKSSSIRTARTAITSAQNGGRQESYEKAAQMGIDVKKVWVATKDPRTRKSHQRMDGKKVSWDGKFPNGLRYPGDESGRPEEVYNCRCRMRTDVPRELEAEPRKMRVETPEYTKALELEKKADRKLKNIQKQIENEKDENKLTKLKNQEREAKKQLSALRKKRKETTRTVVVNEMTYEEWEKWVKSRE